MSTTTERVSKKRRVLDTVISMVSCATDTETRDIRVGAVLNGIRTGGKNLKGQIQQIRNRFESEMAFTSDRKKARLAIDSLKKQLPAVTFSGVFEQRANDKLLKYSGLLVADLDSLGPQLEEVRRKLEASPHVMAVFLSPSGDGLKVIFRVTADASKHLASYRAIEKHVLERTGIQVDQACKDPSRLCFMSYDKQLHTNFYATEIEPLKRVLKGLEPQGAINPNVNLGERQRIAVEILGEVDWQSETSGLCTCPGKHLHTTGDGKRDCRVDLDSVPTAHCFHDSCHGILDGVNHELRSRIAKTEYHARAETPGVDLWSKGEVEPSDESKSEDEAIRRLAALSLLEYDRIRKDEAKKLGCRPSILDSLIHAKRLLMRPPSETDNLQGAAVKLPDVEPWPEAVNGAEILYAISQRFNHYVVLPDGAADVAALWSAHTHVFNAFQISPRLNVSAPTQECGKTTLRDSMTLFCARAMPTENMTTAVMFRLVAGHRPTILADECDKWLFTNEELVGLVQSGHRKGGHVMRCEGDSNELRKFGCYAPVLLAAIGALPSQLHSRSIVIRLERATREEIKACALFNSDHVEYENELARKLARWIADNRERIESCTPKLPENLFNRIADNWRPLFAIAEVAGGDWPRRCASALVKLTTREDESESLRVMLLGDIQKIFTADRMFSKDLVEALADLKERPWPEICRGQKPISERWLARNLAAFRIHPKLVRIGEDRPARGYALADFKDVFARYVGDTGNLSVTPLQTIEKTESTSVTTRAETAQNQALHKKEGPESTSVTTREVVTDTKNEVLLGKEGICNGVTDKKGDTPLKNEFSAETGINDEQGVARL